MNKILNLPFALEFLALLHTSLTCLFTICKLYCSFRFPRLRKFNNCESKFYFLGFSLTELLSVIAIIALLTSLALPAFESIIIRRKVDSITNQLQTLLIFGRAHSLLFRQTLYLCPGQALPCQENWSKGLILFNSEQTVLKSFPPLTKGYQLTWHGAKNTIQWSKDGRAYGSNGTLCIQFKNVYFSYQKSLIVSNTGKIKKL